MMATFKDTWEEAFESIMEKGENADNQPFLLFPNAFYHIKQKYFVSLHFIILYIQP